MSLEGLMKGFGRALISLLLAIVLCFSSAFGIFSALGDMQNDEETPIAVIENDFYVPYSYDSDSLNSDIENLKYEVESAGGVFEYYDSEEQYRAFKQEAKPLPSSENIVSEQVKQVITVMTTPTGQGNNKKESEPVKNALIRLDGIPRYSDESGQIRVNGEKGKYVELVVEKDGFNPYIEIIEITGQEKIVYLKKPSDDIEIYSAMLSYAGEAYNVLTQKCIINNDIIKYHYSELTIMSNVKAEEYYILVNGYKRYYSDEPTFYDIKFDDLYPGDKLSVQVVYQGIESEPVDTFIEIQNIEATTEKYGDEVISESPGFTLETEDKDKGIFEGFSFDLGEWLETLELISPESHLDTFELEYNTRTGDVTIRVGFKWEDDYTKKLNAEKEYLKENIFDKCNDYYDTNEELKELQRELSENDRQIKEAKKDLGNNNDEVRKLERQKKELHNKIMNLKGGQKQNAPYMKEQQKQLQEKINELKEYTHEKDKQVKDLIEKQQRGEISLKALKARLNMIKGFIGYLKDEYNRKGRTVSLVLDVVGVFKYNTYKNQISELVASASLGLEVSWDGMFLAGVVPLYYEVSGGISGGLEIQFYSDGTLINFDNFIKKILAIINVKARGEFGVGVNGILSAGIFAALDAEFKTYAFARDAEGVPYLFEPVKWGSKVDIRVGIILKALLWEWEYGAEWRVVETKPEEPLYDGIGGGRARLITGQGTGGDKVVSENQVSGRSYLESTPQTVSAGENTVSAWIEEDASRDAYNSTVLKYSVMQDGTWGEVKSVFDNGTSDFYHDLYSDGENIYIVWQKMSRLLTAEDDLLSAGEASDIYFAKFDKNSGEFSDIQCISQDNTGDFIPQIALKEDKDDALTVIWLKNSQNNILGFNGVNSLYSSSYIGGSWSAPSCEYESEKYFSFISAAYKEGALNIAFTQFEDIYTSSQRQIKVVVGKDEYSVASGEKLVNTQFTLLSGKSVLSYFDGERVVLAEDYAELNTINGLDADRTGDDYKMIETADSIYILYKKANADDVSQIYCSLYDKNDKNWTYDITLTNEEHSVYKWHVAIDEAGAPLLSYSVTDEDLNCYTCVTSINLVSDFDIQDVFTDGIIVGGKATTFILQVENTGQKNLNDLCVYAFGESKCADKIVAVGATEFIEVSFDLPEVLPEKETFEVRSGSVAKTYEVDLIYTDVSIDGEVNCEGEIQSFDIRILNNSQTLTTVTLDIFVNGSIADNISFSVEAGKMLEYRYVAHDLSLGDTVYFVASTDIKDIYISDNSIMLISIKDMKKTERANNIYKELLQNAKGLLW